MTEITDVAFFVAGFLIASIAAASLGYRKMRKLSKAYRIAPIDLAQFTAPSDDTHG